MSESEALFGVLRQSADAGCVAAIEQLVREAPTATFVASMSSISPPNTASMKSGPSPRSCMPRGSALFELSWNVLCPGCGGVLDASTTLKTVNHDEYDLRAVRRRLRADARRDGGGDLHRQPPRPPHRRAQSRHASMVEYFRQIFWAPASIFPETLDESFAERHARHDRVAARREGGIVAAAAGEIPDRRSSR